MSALSSTFMKPVDFEANKITFSELKSFGTQAKQVFVSYNTAQRVAFSTPKMRMPYGLSKFQNDGAQPKYSVDISFDGMENEIKIKSFYNAIESFDNKVKSEAKQNSLIWLKRKDVSDELIDQLFTPSIKRSKDKTTGEFTNKYAPTFKGKLSVWEGSLKCVVFDNNRSKIENNALDQLTRGRSITTIVRCKNIWFINGKFGVSWEFEQIKLDKPTNLIGYAFRDDDED